MGDEKGSLLKDLAKLIPGYGTYVEQESRRNDDRLVRDFVCERLSDCKSKMIKIGQAALESGDLDAPTKTEKVREELDRAQSRLKSAVEGYAGWFGHREVNAELLKEICDLDSNLVSLVDQADALGQSAMEGGEANWGELKEIVERLHGRIDRREQLLKSGN